MLAPDPGSPSGRRAARVADIPAHRRAAVGARSDRCRSSGRDDDWRIALDGRDATIDAVIPAQATEVTRPRQVTWRERAIEIVIIVGSLLILLPAMLIYGLLVEVPRDLWRTVRWSRDPRLAVALPAQGALLSGALSASSPAPLSRSLASIW
jgi:hypothetical protein